MPKRNNYYRSRKPINQLFGDIQSTIQDTLIQNIGEINVPESANRIGEAFITNLLHELAHQEAHRERQMLVNPNVFANLLRMQEDGEI
jgi:hypothetical protein